VRGPVPGPEARALFGTWRVDLRPDPAAAPAEAPFVVTAAPGDSLVGSFYGSPIRQARVNRAWGRLHVAFVTYDNTGVYHHTAVLVAPDRLDGTSHALGRGFLAVWRAVRADSAGSAASTRP
jgi:hypothetical protein